MSENPAERLRNRIRRDGPISFEVFMEEALYGEGGYYARRELPIGPDGDFVTGSSHSPHFGRTTAELLGRLDRELGAPADYLEVGYGSGAHLRATMAASETPRRWLACDRFERRVGPGVEVAENVGRWPKRSVRGLIFSYELFDALPVRRLLKQGSELLEMGVDLGAGDEFVWHEMALSNSAFADLVPDDLESGQVADVADWGAAYGRLARRLDRGLMVTFDYGFERPRLFDPRVRSAGTLACYRRQRVHRDALADPGQQDLTAHVDFTAITAAGEDAGLETVALTRQAPWLATLGILEGLAERSANDRVDVMTLLDLEGMGEEIRVLVQSRELDPSRLFDTALLG